MPNLSTSLAATAFAGVVAVTPWPHGEAPSRAWMDEQLRDAVEVAELERMEEQLAAAEFGESSDELRISQEKIDGAVYGKLDRLFRMGDAFFDHAFLQYDGFGPRPDGQGDRKSDAHRLQRVHSGVRGGLDTHSCSGCHSVGGADGAGSEPENVHIEGDGVRLSSALVRNAPPLLGLGFVQKLGVEMTDELAAARRYLQSRADKAGAPVRGELQAKGISFGFLTVHPGGNVDTSEVRGVDPDLVVKPFGWKGNIARLRRFVEEAARMHFGAQSRIMLDRHVKEPDVARLGSGAAPYDPDEDGNADELREGVLTTGAVYMAMLEAPTMLPPFEDSLRERWSRGRVRFNDLGCASCHVVELPMMGAEWLETSDTTGKSVKLHLVTDGEKPRPRFIIPLFSDLKRHDMGEALADPHPSSDGVAPREWLTRPLWGIAESGPYLHDGRAATLDEAISAHDGEARAARDAFSRAPASARADLRVFLLSLTREPRLRVMR